MKITQEKENMLMKKLGKKLAILAVIGAASIGFVGCGNSTDNPEQTEETTTVENVETQSRLLSLMRTEIITKTTLF